MRPTEARGEVLALLLNLVTRTMLVRVPVILVVTAFILILDISPMPTWVLWPVPPRLRTSLVRLLTEQTLRRGGGETRFILGAERCIPVT